MTSPLTRRGVIGVHLERGVSLRGCSVPCTEGTEPLSESCGQWQLGTCLQLHLELEGSQASCKCSLRVHPVNVPWVTPRSFVAQLRAKAVTALSLAVLHPALSHLHTVRTWLSLEFLLFSEQVPEQGQDRFSYGECVPGQAGGCGQGDGQPPQTPLVPVPWALCYGLSPSSGWAHLSSSPDYDTIRNGGLIFAVVAFVIGLLIILSEWRMPLGSAPCSSQPPPLGGGWGSPTLSPQHRGWAQPAPGAAWELSIQARSQHRASWDRDHVNI